MTPQYVPPLGISSQPFCYPRLTGVWAVWPVQRTNTTKLKETEKKKHVSSRSHQIQTVSGMMYSKKNTKKIWGYIWVESAKKNDTSLIPEIILVGFQTIQILTIVVAQKKTYFKKLSLDLFSSWATIWRIWVKLKLNKNYNFNPGLINPYSDY